MAAAGFGPDDDLYALLGVSIDSTTKEISSAYRKKARDVHPDKNPSADAAVLFHKLRKATEVLLDEKAREAYDNLVRAKLKRKQRDEKLDAQRKKLRDDLLERERQARDKKSTEEEARRVFEEQLARMRADAKSQKRPAFDMDLDLSDDDDSTSAPKKDAAPASPAPPPSAFTDMDRTVQLRWDARGGTYDEATISRLLRQFGPVDMLVINKKGTNALVAFSSILDAQTLILKAPSLSEFSGIKAGWASGKPPAALLEADRLVRERLRASPQPSSASPMARLTPDGLAGAPLFGSGKPLFSSDFSPSAGGSLSSSPSGATLPKFSFSAQAVGGLQNKDYESLTLMRMLQQKERQRALEQLQREEEEEERALQAN